MERGGYKESLERNQGMYAYIRSTGTVYDGNGGNNLVDSTMRGVEKSSGKTYRYDDHEIKVRASQNELQLTGEYETGGMTGTKVEVFMRLSPIELKQIVDEAQKAGLISFSVTVKTFDVAVKCD